MNPQSSTQDLNDSKLSQSMERYLQADQQSVSPQPKKEIVQTPRIPQASSILKLQNGKYSNDIFKEALTKKKSELHKRNRSQSTPKERSKIKIEKAPKKQDKVKQNIANAKQYVKKNPVQQEPLYKHLQIKTNEPYDESKDQAFLETVERLYTFDKRRKQQLEKAIIETKEKEKQIASQKPLINEKSCALLDKKFKQLIDDEEEFKQIYQHRDKETQADLLPNLPKLKDFQQRNMQNGKEESELTIVVDLIENEEEDDIETVFQEDQNHKKIQTEEIKYRISDTIKKQQEQKQQNSQVTQFQTQDTPQKQQQKQQQQHKKTQNQRQKRQEIMQNQGNRVKTECQYYIPIQERYKQVINKKEIWVQQQLEIKKQQEEEQLNLEQVNKSMDQVAMDPEEFQKQQMSWLEKRNENILHLQMKKDAEMLGKLTFKPEIGQSSKHLGNKKNQKVEDRLLEYQQKKQENLMRLENNYLPTFQPNLQTKQLILSQHLSQTISSKSLTNASFNNNHHLWQ